MGLQEKKTIESTADAEFASICREIKSAGYDAPECWIAHCHPSAVTPDGAKTRRKIAADHGLSVVALAVAHNTANLAIAEARAAPCINGGFRDADVDTVKKLLPHPHVNYNDENHPEKTPHEVLEKIEGGSHHVVPLGTAHIAIDTVLAELNALGYTGHLSWEEPEDRNPFDIAPQMRQYIASRW